MSRQNPKAGNNPQAQKKNNYYLRSQDNKLIFAKVNGEPVYTKNHEKVEMYPVENGEEIFIVTSKGPIYAKNSSNREYYPRDKDKNDKPIILQGKIQFIRDSIGNEYYPENANGIQQFNGQFARTARKLIKYPLNELNKPVYEKDPITGDEMYHIDELTGTAVIGKDKIGSNVYAKRANGDEFFLATDGYAKNWQGFPVYPLTKDGKIIFPKRSEGDEYYLVDENGNDIFTSDQVMLPRYAKSRFQDEIYPVKYVDPHSGRMTEVVLQYRYARDSNNQPYYPFDGYGNEFILEKNKNGIFDEGESFPASYPITNDRFIIVPNITRKPYFINNELSPTKDNIKGKLFRDILGYHDYITDVPSVRKSRSPTKSYKFLPPGATKEETRYPIVYFPVNRIPLNPIPQSIPKKTPQGINWLPVTLVIFLLIASLITLWQMFKKK